MRHKNRRLPVMTTTTDITVLGGCVNLSLRVCDRGGEYKIVTATHINLRISGTNISHNFLKMCQIVNSEFRYCEILRTVPVACMMRLTTAPVKNDIVLALADYINDSQKSPRAQAC